MRYAGAVRDFEERQQFRQWWLLLLLAVTVLAGWSPLIVRALGGDGAKDDPVWALVLVVFLGGVLLPGWLLFLQLQVSVDVDGVRIRYRGLPIDRLIPFGEIVEYDAVTYRPVYDYGGWGVRWRGRGKMAYSVSGDRGVRIDLADGKEIMIGSQRAEELAAAMTQYARR